MDTQMDTCVSGGRGVRSCQFVHLEFRKNPTLTVLGMLNRWMGPVRPRQLGQHIVIQARWRWLRASEDVS